MSEPEPVGGIAGQVIGEIEKLRLRTIQFRLDIKEKLDALSDLQCEDHPEVTLIPNLEKSTHKSLVRAEFYVVYDPCPMCVEENRAEWLRDRWGSTGIPKKVIRATFDNFELYDKDQIPEMERAISKFKKQIKRKMGFVIALGKVGTGKSHLAAAAIKETGDGIFVTEHDLIGELRQTYTKNSGQDEMVEKYRSTPMLVLDEISKDVKGTDIAPLLYRVLGYRHDNDLPTILTSNEEREAFMEIIGPKIKDRLRESYVIVNFTWKSHRTNAEN